MKRRASKAELLFAAVVVVAAIAGFAVAHAAGAANPSGHAVATIARDGVVLYLVVARDAVGVLEPLRGLYDDELVGFDRDAVRVKIVFFTSAAKADTDYFCQRSSSNSTAKPPSVGPTPTL